MIQKQLIEHYFIFFNDPAALGLLPFDPVLYSFYVSHSIEELDFFTHALMESELGMS
uniref:Uncharacterized protein n=1 Tax=Arion vulgaris TaxID=1028688 RepID=A0A0B7ABJ2_9EUPU